METNFFPSRTLTFYLAKLFVTRVLAILIMLVLVLQMLDLLSESGDILAVKGNGEAQLMPPPKSWQRSSRAWPG